MGTISGRLQSVCQVPFYILCFMLMLMSVLLLLMMLLTSILNAIFQVDLGYPAPVCLRAGFYWS